MILVTAAALPGQGIAPAQDLPPPVLRSTSQETDPPQAFAPEAGKGILERSTLTGTWWGARDTLSAHGIELNINLSQFYQGVADGGTQRSFEYGGKLDYFLNLDGAKLGLWEGFSITTHAET